MNSKKHQKTKSRERFSEFFGRVLATMVILLFLGACQQNGEDRNEEDPNVLADKELVRDQGFDRATDGPQNELAPENVGSFERWDIDGDGRWNKEEFERITSESRFYERWDLDKDGTYSEEELNTGIFTFYDLDGDGNLDEDEFTAFTSAWNVEGTDEFQEWDVNKDAFIDMDEYSGSIYNAGIYDEWEEESEEGVETTPGVKVTDGSRIFGENEVEEGLFNVYDTDNNGYITKEEYIQTQTEDYLNK